MSATDPPDGAVGGVLVRAGAGHVYGNPDAAVAVVEFGDLECPYCRAAAPVLRRLVDGSAGTVRLVFRHFPLFEVHPHALTAALAAEAAGAQGHFWAMHDHLFADQDHLRDTDLAAAGREIGLDGVSVVGDAAQEFAGRVEQDYSDGLALGVTGTPTLFVGGERYTGRLTLPALRERVAEALAGGTPTGS